MQRIKQSDFTLADHGSIALLHQNTQAAKQWVAEHVDHEGWQVFGSALAIEPRCASVLVDGLLADGYTLEVC